MKQHHRWQRIALLGLAVVAGFVAPRAMADLTHSGTTVAHKGLFLQGTACGWLANTDGLAGSTITLHVNGETLRGCQPLARWIGATLGGGVHRESGSIQSVDFERRDLGQVTFTNATITEIAFPALDAGRGEATTLVLKITPESSASVAATHAPSAQVPFDLRRQRSWLPTNFRLTIADLPRTDVDKVSAVEAITVRRAGVVLPSGSISEAPSIERERAGKNSGLQTSQFVVTLADSHAQSFRDWFKDAQKDPSKAVKSGTTLDYLTANLQDRIATLSFGQVTIVAVDAIAPPPGKDVIKRTKVTMNVAAVGFQGSPFPRQ